LLPDAACCLLLLITPPPPQHQHQHQHQHQQQHHHQLLQQLLCAIALLFFADNSQRPAEEIAVPKT
jgi:hypothetical protein